MSSVGRLTAKRHKNMGATSRRDAASIDARSDKNDLDLFSFKSNKFADGGNGQRYQIGNALLYILLARLLAQIVGV